MIVGALLVRDEAADDRYLQRVLRHQSAYCDTIVTVDDGSTDATPDLCAAYGPVHRYEAEGGRGWWGVASATESSARAVLWQHACAVAGEGNWLLVFDADMELVGVTPDELRALTTLATTVNAFALPVYDCWNSETRMRVDRKSTRLNSSH